MEKVGPRRSGCGVRTTFMHRFLAGPREDSKGGRYIPRNKERKRRGRMGSPVTDGRADRRTYFHNASYAVRAFVPDKLGLPGPDVCGRGAAPRPNFLQKRPTDRILDGRR